jgi:cell wall assembly regulator SMI1
MTLRESMKLALETLATEDDPPLNADLSAEHKRLVAELQHRLDVQLDRTTLVYLEFVSRERSGHWVGESFQDWGNWVPLTIEEIGSEWRATIGLVGDEGISADRGIQPKWFHSKWLPIASDGGGNLLCVDCDPAEGGTVGQVIEFDHEQTCRPKRATDLLELLEQLAIERKEIELATTDSYDSAEVTARFLVDGDAVRAQISVYSESSQTPLFEGTTPASFRLPFGRFSACFRHDGRTHWRREFVVAQRIPYALDLHW